MRCYLGIDGGGSKTRALLCDEELNTVSFYQGNGINYNSIGMEKARENLREVYNAVLSDGIELSSVFIGSAALGKRADRETVEEFCSGIIDCDLINMDSDVYIGLKAMRKPSPCAFAVCGTGSMAAGILPDGKIITSGGWGHILGDEGSGYVIATEALKAVLRYHDDSNSDATLLTGAALDFFDINKPEELIDIFYTNSIERSRASLFAEKVIGCAEKGDNAAINIIIEQAEKFARSVCSLLKKMPQGTPLGLWGGVFLNSQGFLSAFSSCVLSDFPETDISIISNPPEFGAVLAAKEIAENEI